MLVAGDMEAKFSRSRRHGIPIPQIWRTQVLKLADIAFEAIGGDMVGPASQKTVTPQTIIGEGGIALIQQRALDMGYLFHPRRVDHGIDGHLDLVDSRTGALLSLTILVQSKARDLPFAGEDANGFHYICRPEDLDLWLAGNAPVLLIFSHPAKGEAWWVDIKGAFPSPQSRASRRIDVDKNTQRFDRDAAQALLDLGKPQGQGLYLRPPPKPETLESNLLPIVSMPSTIFLAESAASDYPAAGALLAGSPRTRDVWVLRDGNIISFHDLSRPPLSALTASPVEQHDTAEWAATNDPDLQWTFVDLLTRTIQGSYPELRWHKARKHVHFRASDDMHTRKIPSGSGTRKRTVFTGHGDDGQGNPGYFSHAALKLRIRQLGDRWYAQLEPDYCFTSDGSAEHRNADLLLAGIKRLDRHAAVKGWVRMWGLFLQGRTDLFSEDLPISFGPLLTFDVGEGIDDAHWGPMPEEFDRDGDGSDGGASEGQVPIAATPYDDDLLSILADDELRDPDCSSDLPAGNEKPPAKNRPRRRATRSAGNAG